MQGFKGFINDLSEPDRTFQDPVRTFETFDKTKIFIPLLTDQGIIKVLLI